jgi:hypothetical protein
MLREEAMRYVSTLASLAGAALLLGASTALSQIKTTNQGISDTEIVLGTHEDSQALSRVGVFPSPMA